MPVAITGSTSIDYDISGEGPPLLLIGGLGFGRWGSFSAEGALRRGLQTATPEAYRAEHGEEFERILDWRLADSPSDAGCSTGLDTSSSSKGSPT